MARHSPDAKTQELKVQMDATRGDLRVAVKGLRDQGIKENEVARAAGWSQSYLSQFLSGGGDEKMPLPAKIGALIRAVHLLATEQPGAQAVRDAIESVAIRYGIQLAPLANPAQPISTNAPNFIARSDVDAFIRNWIAAPGAYFILGTPSVGLSSALLRSEHLLRSHGYEVCGLSVRDDLMVPGLIERSRTGIIGALAARMVSSEDPLELGIYAVEDVIRDCFRNASAPGYALVLDDVDGIPDKDAQELASVLRAWKNRRAAGEAGFKTATVWSAFTSNIVSPTAESWYDKDAAMVVRWFDEEKELGALARVFAPRAMQADADKSWADAITKRAYAYFKGQPRLSHLFLWDRSRDGGLDFPSPDEHVPEGAYAQHLDRLSRKLIMILGIRLALDAVKMINSGEQIPPSWVPVLLERVRICENANGAWSCPYYRDHFPAALERRAASMEVVATRESRTRESRA